MRISDWSSDVCNGSIMGALYKGLIVTGLLSIVGLGAATSFTIGWGSIGTVDGMDITGTNLFLCGILGLVVTALIVVITEYYTGTNKDRKSTRLNSSH